MDTVPEKSEYDYGLNYMPLFPLTSRGWSGRASPSSAGSSGSAPGSPARNSRRRRLYRACDRHPGSRTAQRRCCRHTSRDDPCCAFDTHRLRDFRLYADVPWVQFWWSVTFFNAWFMVVGDDPLTWFYYNWGFSGFPIVVFMWWVHRLCAPSPQGLENVSREATLGCT